MTAEWRSSPTSRTRTDPGAADSTPSRFTMSAVKYQVWPRRFPVAVTNILSLLIGSDMATFRPLIRLIAKVPRSSEDAHDTPTRV